MSLSVCSECQTVEGGWREPTLKEREENDIELSDKYDLECLVCEACDSIGSYQGVPDHDDMDLER